jgi:hypothetical protein
MNEDQLNRLKDGRDVAAQLTDVLLEITEQHKFINYEVGRADDAVNQRKASGGDLQGHVAVLNELAARLEPVATKSREYTERYAALIEPYSAGADVLLDIVGSDKASFEFDQVRDTLTSMLGLAAKAAESVAVFSGWIGSTQQVADMVGPFVPALRSTLLRLIADARSIIASQGRVAKLATRIEPLRKH